MISPFVTPYAVASKPPSVDPDEQELASAAAPEEGGSAGTAGVPAFITPASLVTVSGGTAAVTLLWQVAQVLLGPASKNPWVPFLISLAIGAVIYVVSIGDRRVQAGTRDKIVGLFIGFLNSMVLFAAALGLTK